MILLQNLLQQLNGNKLKMRSLLILLIFLSSCSTPYWYKPYGYMSFKHLPKGGSPGFNLGWIHGCESGLGTQFGGALYQTFYTWHRDVDITINNTNYDIVKRRYKKELAKVDWSNIEDIKRNYADYNKIFWKAHLFCRHSVLGTLQNAGFNPNLPGESRFEFTNHSLGSIWSISGTGDTRIGRGQW
jgi:hypothetical protein